MPITPLHMIMIQWLPVMDSVLKRFLLSAHFYRSFFGFRPLGNGKATASTTSGIRAPPVARAPVAPPTRTAPAPTRPAATSEFLVEPIASPLHPTISLAKPAKISPSVHRPAPTSHHGIAGGDHHHHGGHNDSYRLQQEVGLRHIDAIECRSCPRLRIFKKSSNNTLLKWLVWKRNETSIIKNYAMSN